MVAEEERNRDPLSDDVWVGWPLGRLVAVLHGRDRAQARPLGADRHWPDLRCSLAPAAEPTWTPVNAARDPARSLCPRRALAPGLRVDAAGPRALARHGGAMRPVTRRRPNPAVAQAPEGR